MLKLAGEFEVGREKIESIVLEFGAPNTGDLEAGTKTISATTEASGVGNADYSSSKTLPKPSDVRLEVKRICARLAVTIDSTNGGFALQCRVYVDAQDADHRLFDVTWDNITGQYFEVIDLTSGTIFDLLSDGSAHTFYFFFWSQYGGHIISQVQLWEGVGTYSTSRQLVLQLSHEGFCYIYVRALQIGSGSGQYTLFFKDQSLQRYKADTSNDGRDLLLIKDIDIKLKGTVATDLNYIDGVAINLRSEQ